MTSQSRAIRSKSKKSREFVEIMAQFFLNCESTCDSAAILASTYQRKTATRPFDTVHYILPSLSLVQCLLKGIIALI